VKLWREVKRGKRFKIGDSVRHEFAGQPGTVYTVKSIRLISPNVLPKNPVFDRCRMKPYYRIYAVAENGLNFVESAEDNGFIGVG